LSVAGAASVTAVGVGQRIEQLNSYDLAGSTATLSVYISNSLLTTVTWTASYATSADTWSSKTQIATGTFTVSATRTQYTTNITIPAAATTGIEILFTVGAQISGTWVIDSVQLEAGAVATSFDWRPYVTELHLCQRYCQVFRVYPASGFDSFMSYYGGTNALSSVKRLTTQMRTTPTAAFTSGTVEYYSFAGAWTSTSLVASIVSNEMYYIYCASDGDGRSKLMRNGGSGLNADPVVTFAAEL
jgi:hypothetical protein